MGEVVPHRIGCGHLDVVGETGELGRHDLGRVAADLDGDPTVVAGLADGEARAEHAAQDAHDVRVGRAPSTLHGARRSSSVDSTVCHVSARSNPVGSSHRFDR